VAVRADGFLGTGASRKVNVDGTVPRIALFAGALALALTACGGPAPPQPTVAPTPEPAPSAPPTSGAQHPAEVLDLDNWYLTLPTGREGDPDDVYPPDLDTFSDPWFRLTDAGDGVVFTANAGGVTTEGSSYPRSELREMANGELASWSNTRGTHTLDVRQAVTRLPDMKPHVVTAQIHDAEDDVVEVRLEGVRLIAEYDDGDGEVVIDPAYELGTPYDLRITAAGGSVEIFYNGRLAADIPKSGSGWYFKSGSYVQSNPTRGDAPDATAAVILYALTVEHSA
jgi:poly(beta-D-mannuronate) lyase